MNKSQINVLVTRPAHQAKKLCEQLSNAGLNPVPYPTIKIVPVEKSNHSSTVFDHLSDYQFIFFISANAVTQAGAQNNTWPAKNTHYIAIGPTTAEALHSIGLTPSYIAEKPFNSEQLLKQLPCSTKNSSALIIKGQGGRDFLAKELQNKGFIVDTLDVYKRCAPTINSPIPAETPLHFVTITSQLALENLAMLQADKFSEMQRQSCFVLFSQRIEKLAKKMGCERTLVAKSASNTDLVMAIKHQM